MAVLTALLGIPYPPIEFLYWSVVTTADGNFQMQHPKYKQIDISAVKYGIMQKS